MYVYVYVIDHPYIYICDSSIHPCLSLLLLCSSGLVEIISVLGKNYFFVLSISLFTVVTIVNLFLLKHFSSEAYGLMSRCFMAFLTGNFSFNLNKWHHSFHFAFVISIIKGLVLVTSLTFSFLIFVRY